jgi:hypothetical protein
MTCLRYARQSSLKRDLDTMKSITRVFVSAIAALATFYLMSVFFPFLRIIPVARLQVLVKLLCAGVAARYTWQHTAWASPGLAICMLFGGVVTGAIGFSAGFFGPLIYHPEANQGPLLGIILTGPLGFLAGAAAGAIYWRMRSKSKAA